MQLIILLPLPDETLSSWLSRISKLNGFQDFRDTANNCLGGAPYASFIDAMVDLQNLRSLSNGLGASPSDLLRTLTCVDLQHCLGEVKTETVRALGNGSLKVSLRELTFYGRAEFRLCPRCVASDTFRFGVAYWHRLHQLAPIRYCENHGDLLRKITVRPAQLHRSFPSPADFSRDEVPILPTGEESQWFWLGLSATAKSALRASRLPESQIVEAALKAELKCRGLINASGVIRTNEVTKWLYAQPWHSSLEPDECLRRAFTARLARCVAEPEQGLPLGRLILIQALFGTWRAFEEKCAWIETMGIPHYPKPGQPSLPSDHIVQMHRQACIDFFIAHPRASRTDFAHSAYKSFHWLARNDKRWLDDQLPKLQSRPKQYGLF